MSRMKTWAELSTAERMSPRKRWDTLAEEINKLKTSESNNPEQKTSG
jgi:hypothetical protein|nr:MAG TPA: hypothetical protein [Caudoviricetes sp.]